MSIEDQGQDSEHGNDTLSFKEAKALRDATIDGLLFIQEQGQYLPHTPMDLKHPQRVLQKELFNALAGFAARLWESQATLLEGFKTAPTGTYDQPPIERVDKAFEHVTATLGSPQLRLIEIFRASIAGTPYATDSEKPLIHLDTNPERTLKGLHDEIQNVQKQVESDKKHNFVTPDSIFYYLYKVTRVATELLAHEDDIRTAAVNASEGAMDFDSDIRSVYASVGRLFCEIALLIPPRVCRESMYAVKDRVEKIRGAERQIREQGGPGRTTGEILTQEGYINALKEPLTVKHDPVYNASGYVIG